MRETLQQTIKTAAESQAFRNYLDVRDRVLHMLDEAEQTAELPSDYWQQELAGFDYMLDASPLIIQKLREHCYHITGLRSYDYRQHHAHQQETFAKKLQALQQLDSKGLLVPESPLLGGFGHPVDGKLINIDTLKFYECLVALEQSGLLELFRNNQGERKVVLEIGAGWGGFAYQFKTLCPNTCYIIIDLPQTLLFSAVYLKTLFPTAVTLFYGDKPKEQLLADISSCDFIFLPHFFLKDLQLDRLDLAINMVSFQEMTTEQVEGYVRQIHQLKCPNFYSLNRDRSGHNLQLTSVSSILAQYYDPTEINLLNVSYTSLNINRKREAEKSQPSSSRLVKSQIKGLGHSVKGVIHSLLDRLPRQEGDQQLSKQPEKTSKKHQDRRDKKLYDYRHLVGIWKQKVN